MADARVLVEEETENTTEELTDSLLSINGKNQFKWNGSAELLESFLYKKLGLSADDVTTSSNGTCTVWKTPSVTFNLYIKTKTLLVQGKAVDSTRDLLLQTIQADKNQTSVEAPDETNNIHFAAEHITGVHQQARLMSPTTTSDIQNDHSLVREDSDDASSENESESESEYAQLAPDTNEVLINNPGEKFFNEIAKIWSEISSIKSSLTNRDGLRPLQQELDELRFKCTTYESTIDHLEKEKASLLEVIKILSADDNSNCSTDTSDGNKTSDFTTRDNEWTEVSNSKKKKKKPKVTNAEARHQNITNTRAKEPRRSTSNTSHTDANSNPTTRQKPSVIIAGDSMLKFVNGRKLSNLLSHQSSTYVKTFPGATVEDMSDYVMPSLRRKPTEVILHVGTNDIKTSEPREIAEGIVDLGLKIQNHSPDCNVTISSLILRADENLDCKINEVNRIVKRFAKQYAWRTISHSNIKRKHLNDSGLHLNVQGTKLLVKNLVSHLNL